MRSVTSYLVVLFVLDLCTEIHDETVQVPSTITCPFAFARSSHFQSWSGVSNRIIFKACNVSDAQGRNCLKILYLCAVFLLKGDAPTIEFISIAKEKRNTARLHGYFA